MTWYYKGQALDAPPDGTIGFVYIIYNLQDGRQYIGKKLVKFRKTKTVKGKKKRELVDSDWKTYWGSNDELKADVERLGESSFRREIIHFAKNKGTLSYLELKEQMDHRVLEHPNLYYNRWVMARISTSHVKLS